MKVKTNVSKDVMLQIKSYIILWLKIYCYS